MKGSVSAVEDIILEIWGASSCFEVGFEADVVRLSRILSYLMILHVQPSLGGFIFT